MKIFEQIKLQDDFIFNSISRYQKTYKDLHPIKLNVCQKTCFQDEETLKNSPSGL